MQVVWYRRCGGRDIAPRILFAAKVINASEDTRAELDSFSREMEER